MITPALTQTSRKWNSRRIGRISSNLQVERTSKFGQQPPTVP